MCIFILKVPLALQRGEAHIKDVKCDIHLKYTLMLQYEHARRDQMKQIIIGVNLQS